LASAQKRRLCLTDQLVVLPKYLVLTPLLSQTVARTETDRDCPKKNDSGSDDLLKAFLISIPERLSSICTNGNHSPKSVTSKV
jgi:hypothetical protein